jgi:hypothetical protein
MAVYRTLTLLLLAAGWLAAQEYRATLLGAVIDPSGASVPNARVTATNTQTGVSVISQTGADGNYVIPFLLPGAYSLRVEAPGFKTFERSPIELRINDRTRIDAAIEIGQAADKVTVVAEAPLLETASSSRGQVIGQRAIADMPLNSRNPFTLMNLATGVQYTGSMMYFRPFDNGAIGNFSINGGRDGINEYQIDGASNNTNSGTMLAYVPPVEATQEFKIQANTYDAQYGRTSGGVISVSIKPGTNSFHGAAYEYLRRTQLEANLTQNNANRSSRAEHMIDQYGWELDGPVRLPRLYNGKDRTFFMFSQERYREFTPQPGQVTVPTELERAGDFSQSYKTATQQWGVYDPLSVYLNPAYDTTRPITAANTKYLRQPYAGNRVSRSLFNPIAVRVLQDIPLPNQAGDPYTHVNNWYAGYVGEATDFQNLIARLDHNVGSRWRLYGRWNYNDRDGGRINYAGWDTPARNQIHAGRRNDGAVLDAVSTLNPHTILSLRVSYNRFRSHSVYDPIDISTLGFPKSLLSLLPISNKYPIFNFEGYQNTGINEWNIAPNETYSGQASMTKVAGSHSMKFGTEYRLIHQATISRSDGMGNYSFNRNWTRRTPDFSDPNSGQGIATFLLGTLSGASVAINAQTYFTWKYPVLFFQDDWQITRRLTLNLGLRWDREGAPVERFDRQVRGIDFRSKFPIEVPGMPNLVGGLRYAGVNGAPRATFNPDWWNLQPRGGVAYKLLRSKPLVLRGGIGRTFIPTSTTNGATNFSRTTSALTSTSDYRPLASISNPFPDGLLPPLGASLGLATNAGQSISSNNPDRRQPFVWQFSAGLQCELRPGLLLEASYVGSRTRQLGVGVSHKYLTLDQLALGSAYLNTLVPNPFNGYLPSSTSLGTQATVSRRTLMTPFPQFTGVSTSSNSIGASWYNSAQFKVEQRFKHGLSFLLSYTVSKTMEATSYMNSQDTLLHSTLVSFDRPQRVVLSGIYELPVGPKKGVLNRGVVAHIVGGWQLNWVLNKQSGGPLGLPGGYYLMGDPKLPLSTLDKWFNTDPKLWVQRANDTLQTMPYYSPNIRLMSAPQLDANLFRDFYLREGHKLQFKVSAFNALNTPLLGGPTTDPTSARFGMVRTSQNNLPRSIELGFRYAF